MNLTNLFFFFLSFMLISIGLSIGQTCYGTGNFTANSTYGRNRDLILSSLASINATGGFYNATIGQDSDKVYALALCRGDYSSAEECSNCVNVTSHLIMTLCPNQKEAYLWGRLPCFVRYSNRSFYGVLELNPNERLYNTGDIRSNLTEFNQIWENLMDGLVRKASRLKFATGEANLTYFQRIYALMQCTPDLSQTDCDVCLRQYVVEYQNCCRGKQGGVVQGPNCNSRWDLYPFYTSTATPDAPPPSLLPDAPPPSTLPPPTTSTITKDNGGGINSRTVVIIVVSIIMFLVLVSLAYVFLSKRKAKQDTRSKQGRNCVDEIHFEESLRFNFSTIKAATDDFRDDNKLGQGGFGAVYKGRFPNGQDIAVKRLSTNSGQGDLEFKNEVLLMAKLHHRNLVRLLGFCLEGNERLLIYEFVLNSSLDNFIFDPIKRGLLDWETRYRIIGGIARGILYLHEDSRLRIIHRDLKSSNVLLDLDMNPKISDFGMARLFEMDQTQGDTSRIVGTFGYMAPEYIKYGQFSIKSDVFSFGVLVLEIICGKKNSCFIYEHVTVNLLTYAWKNWKDGTALNVIDPALRVGSTSEILRCIHIGLLCVQENVVSRPTMASAVLMLCSSSVSLRVPSKPAFFMHSTTEPSNSEVTGSDQSERRSVQFSVNEVSITELEPR
ncbi:hypothetical protein Dsin_027805 [Dipteronia sinensis]|uniref:Uncharacterized protein n=1 Tax=Dipteronia sinensis TaxID=43782 RepID=A0AAE0DTZ1_9ROSI|nr:hypothetical protein Dsin_027805 [Dipteronia sinensis]